MTDAEIERSNFELFELSKRPCAKRESLFERFDSNGLGESEQHYVGKYVDSYMQEKWELWEKAKAQAVPVTHTHSVTLTCAELKEAYDFGAPDESQEQMTDLVTIGWHEDGHSGAGYYAYMTECEDEGSIKLGESESGAEG
ncbi:TPA: hypothetical protein OXO77_002773 [Acinetobacter baumannii]|uniref:hypothetical protein n=1 Tax=Acinetobacter baumannii TaxID=470 RepID=UPI0002730D3B|nr:hypothetical protein [Acinetobacter baumannii]EHU1273181.1 hypothetical protein [Acinetobacter baumannii]EHU2630618.1 hypothetical protein [Acinetobacter baumannii]EHU2693532.1 hypothetical protein [Acinetobacter baumannii]EHU3243751.1 hypothetical protein [Acinetobacter baumannii]EJG25795.1 hypothetical protein ACIN5109_3329 [Acinetobacter baumannii OIFC109]